MNTKNRITGSIAALFFLLSGSAALADAPKTIQAPDPHSVEVKGKVNLYRVQVEGMKLGEGKELADAELFVTLDSNPKMVYTLELKGNSPASNKVMADTLRDAYVNKLPVTIYHQISTTQANNLKILMVQLN
ncbi:MAG: hypothetical protein L0Z73_09375 [Gammaproteobacteria bacterium]|nr:hypothetical protein [Gammaproteobacteria bacterium]